MENGKIRRGKDLECKNGVMGRCMKGTGTTTKQMEEAS